MASAATTFALRLIAWSLALFGLFRLAWVGTHVLLPVTRLQAAAGSALVGPSSMPVEATLACSGADALALCLAAILAYPAPWRLRAAGLAGGAVLLLALNTIRIGTLGRAAASPRWFDALHVYVWPAVLTLAIAGFVWTWMRVVDRRRPAGPSPRRPAPLGPDWRAARRFALVAAAFLLLFTLAAPLYLESGRVLALGGFVGHAAAFLLRGLGLDATAAGGVLTTPRGAFLVTQECLATPLIPVYLAAVVVYARTWRTRALWTAAAAPLFVGLGIARLLVVAVPAGVGAPPAFLVHAFSQILVAAGMVGGLALWRHGRRAETWARVAVALAVATAFVLWLGAPYTRAVLWLGNATPAVGDPQGALMFLPAFQVGLFLALWIAALFPRGWVPLLGGVSLLAAMQVILFEGVRALAVHGGLAPLVPGVRAWALLGPVLVRAAVAHAERLRAIARRDAAYRHPAVGPGVQLD
jgi:exosortase/archaeosortase family protein